MHRIICTLLLLVVAASQALGGAHAATHFGADTGECALCATYGNPAAEPPIAGLLELSVLHDRCCIDFQPLAEPSTAVLCRHQRGPPARI